ncbi:biotin--[acetyl-CoA-carboxylase] ligase [Rhodobacter maris]|uniref:biotin--[biotin carboxyl-carrier protein] ligase n=1 Tax=Rhodobacter maris TaxID=446682 RepID=A0A285SRB0_9RHOB|nr:biotin--[acetyl-CoA-carboxylase] ligase [Rhodobacter maris]SOC10228.1 BirA family biotin operon repressor/biotin-[acetyl-CoA-carboxylase] ligase [Rhodobacter maris]
MSADADWPEGVARHVLGQTDSTMSEAARLAPHLSGPAWVFAHRQTAGRGRRGRDWIAPEGNFAATCVFRPAVAPPTAALYSFVAALALEEALRRVGGPGPVLSIKWPNDVLLNGGKVAGILLESVSAGGAVGHLAIGIGVNLAAAPPVGTLEPQAMCAVSLSGETGLNVVPLDFLPPLACAFARHAAVFERDGFAPIRAAWLARAARIGQRITARTGTESRDGIFETIDETGALILNTGATRHAISAADIFF